MFSRNGAAINGDSKPPMPATKCMPWKKGLLSFPHNCKQMTLPPRRKLKHLSIALHLRHYNNSWNFALFNERFSIIKYKSRVWKFQVSYEPCIKQKITCLRNAWPYWQWQTWSINFCFISISLKSKHLTISFLQHPIQRKMFFFFNADRSKPLYCLFMIVKILYK